MIATLIGAAFPVVSLVALLALAVAALRGGDDS